MQDLEEPNQPGTPEKEPAVYVSQKDYNNLAMAVRVTLGCVSVSDWKVLNLQLAYFVFVFFICCKFKNLIFNEPII